MRGRQRKTFNSFQSSNTKKKTRLIYYIHYNLPLCLYLPETIRNFQRRQPELILENIFYPERLLLKVHRNIITYQPLYVQPEKSISCIFTVQHLYLNKLAPWLSTLLMDASHLNWTKLKSHLDQTRFKTMSIILNFLNYQVKVWYSGHSTWKIKYLNLTNFVHDVRHCVQSNVHRLVFQLHRRADTHIHFHICFLVQFQGAVTIKLKEITFDLALGFTH